MDRERVVQAANESGAPVISIDAKRETLIAWLQWNDRNGSYDDPYVWCEPPEGMLDEGWHVRTELDGTRFFGRGESAKREALAWAAECTAPISELWELIAEQVIDDLVDSGACDDCLRSFGPYASPCRH